MKKTILFVSDNKTLVMLMGIIIKRMGFNVISAESGPQAADIIDAWRPDAIIIDSELAVFYGLEHLGREKEEMADIPPVILLVGKQTEVAERRRISTGASAVASKPVKAEELHQSLQKCLFTDLATRRRFVRVETELPSNVCHKGTKLALTVESLSAGGAFFRHDKPIDIGTEVDIIMPLGNQESLSVRGKVIYNEKPCHNLEGVCPGFAVKFLDMKTHDTESVKDYVLNLLTDDILEEHDAMGADSYSTIHAYTGRPVLSRNDAV